MNVDIEVETRTKNVFTQTAILAGLLNGYLDPVKGELVLSTDINVTFIRPNRIGGYQHGLYDAERVAFHNDTVLEGSRFAFIGVADDIFLLTECFPDRIPFNAGWKTRASTTA